MRNFLRKFETMAKTYYLIIFNQHERNSKYTVLNYSFIGRIIHFFRKILNFIHNIYIAVWLYYMKGSDTKIIVCASKEDAEVYSNRLKLYSNDVILIKDIKIHKADVEHLNQYYKRHITVVKSGDPTDSDVFLKVDIPDHANIILALGEYNCFTNFELALEAFRIFHQRMRDMYLKKSTVLVILGDELVLEEEQLRYFKKLDGMALKYGLKKNVYFLKISPYITKQIIMKIALAVIFTNTGGCYEKNLFEALLTEKHIIAPNTEPYRCILRKYGIEFANFLFRPMPEVYAKEIYRHVINKFICRLQANMIET